MLRILHHASLRVFVAFLFAGGCGAWAIPVDRLPAGEPPPRFRHLTVDQGLPMNDVRGVVRDAQGFMWFGMTQSGLCRYDGYDFRTYSHDPDDPGSLINDGVWTLLCDRRGTLWIATNGGLDRYDPRSDSFVHYTHRPGDPGTLPHNNVLALFESADGEIWVGTRGGLSHLDRANDTFTTYTRRPHPAFGANINTVRCITEDPVSGIFWVGASDGLGAFDRRTGFFASFLRPARGTEPLNSINAILLDGGGLWVLTEVGLLRFAPQIRAVETIEDPTFPTFKVYRREPGNPQGLISDFLRSGVIDRQGRFWIGSKDGLQLFERGSGRVTPIAHDPIDPDALSDSFVNRVYEDPTGQLWVGTRYGGVNRLRADPFLNFRPPTAPGAPRTSGAISSIEYDPRGGAEPVEGGRLWMGTPHGLYSLDARGWREFLARPGDRSSLSDNYIAALKLDARGRLWVGTFNAGLNVLEGGRFRRFTRDERPAADLTARVLPHTGDQLTSFLATPTGELWVGARAYGIDFQREEMFEHYPPTAPGRPPQPTDYSVLGTVTPDGALWYGTSEHGLIRMLRRENADPEFTRYLMNPAQPSDQLNTAINAVFDDGNGSLWVGNNSGLFRFDLELRRFVRHYAQRDGMANASVVSIIDDTRGRLWIGTGGGISCFDPGTGVFLNYGAGDGLPSAQMTMFTALRLPDGRLVFGSLGGATIFDPLTVQQNTARPMVALTEFSVLGQRVRPGTPDAPLDRVIHTAREIHLSHEQNIFEFRFSALDFTAPNNNRYAYRMDGFDSVWRETDAENRVATYTNLPAGRYTFRVRGSNNHGVWNDDGTAIEVIIAPPWWGAWWARTLFAAAAVGSLLAVYRWRVRRIGRENESLERQIAERRQAEAVVRASEERFRALYEDNPAMYVTLDAAGHVLSVNHFGATMLGYTAEELIGKPVDALFHPDDRDSARREIETCLRRPGELVRLEARKICKDGRVLWVKELARSVRGADGVPIVLVVCEDITARVELESQLRQSQKMEAFGQLAGGVAHDFNNILSVILGQSQLAQDPAATAEERRLSLDDVKEAALRARNLTRQLLAFSRRQTMTPLPADLNQIVQNLARMLERLIGEQISLTLDLAAEPVPVLADAAMLEQVVVNLVVNARDAMPRGGRLTLRTRVSPGPAALFVHPAVQLECVRLEVQDTGVGIPPAILPRIFEPFFTTKEVGQGTGLGLATSLGIVQQHRGTITVESKPGEGTTFRIDLPRHRLSAPAGMLPATPASGALAPSGGASFAARGAHETILLVEDEQAVRLSARRILERAGYRVFDAVNGEEGLRVWEEKQAEINFVLTDVVMPGAIMGRELIARLQARKPDLKFGFMSGYAPDSERAGPHIFDDRTALLPKPFEIQALLRFVRERMEAK